MRRLTLILRCLNILVILATFGAYLAPFISPDQFWPLSFLGLLFPWLLLFNLIFVVGNLVFRSKWIFFSLATIIMGVNHINSFLGFRPVKSFAEEESFILASYNLAQGGILQSKDKKMHTQNILIFNRFLERSVSPQILCLQEMNQPLSEEAVKNSDLVVTDVWASMGQEDESRQRQREFRGYQVSPELMDLAHPDALFMHCLPAHRGEEVSEDMMDDPRCVAFPEAENRLHAQKALLEFLLTH